MKLYKNSDSTKKGCVPKKVANRGGVSREQHTAMTPSPMKPGEAVPLPLASEPALALLAPLMLTLLEKRGEINSCSSAQKSTHVETFSALFGPLAKLLGELRAIDSRVDSRVDIAVG